MDSNATADSDNLTPLMRAAKKGSLEEISVLLDAGADVNDKDDSGMTALMWVTVYGRGHADRIITKLLEAGADIDAKDKSGKTALIYAAEDGRFEETYRLLDYGANTRIRDNSGKRAIDYVAARTKSFPQPFEFPYFYQTLKRASEPAFIKFLRKYWEEILYLFK